MIPPVGVPIRWRCACRPGSALADSFATALEKRLGGWAVLANSGRTALWLVLSAARKLRPDRTEVIIPDYTCWTLPASIARAGLTFRTVDLDPTTLGLERQAVEAALNERTLAVVAPHLFGVPSAIHELEEFCADRRVLLIDDAAQALGARLDGRHAGSFGGVGLLSFGRGKNITTLAGGAALIRDAELAGAITASVENNPLAAGSSSLSDRIQLSMYKMLFPRLLYGVVQALPFLGIGKTYFDPDFRVAGLGHYRQRVGACMLDDLDTITEFRRQRAGLYTELLGGLAQFAIPKPPIGSRACWLRYPVLVPSEEIRNRILAEGRSLGISGMYPSPVSQVGAAKKYCCNPEAANPNSLRVSRTLLTLPTHHGVRDGDIERIVALLRSVE
jgi:dTDP-4-amino-4,6-dideoxygalactose transaminase